jgi:predicted aspartyl protease
MGRVVVEAVVESLEDSFRASRGEIPASEIRSVTIPDALVDTGATTLCLPTRHIRQLGLVAIGERNSMSSQGRRIARIYGPVRLTIQDRLCNIDVVEVSDEVPTLVGQVPLGFLDFVVDPPGRRLIGNPAHGGEQMLEMY